MHSSVKHWYGIGLNLWDSKWKDDQGLKSISIIKLAIV